ncbi:MAG: ribbon-helix-helix protein, CopG family [Actinobacteria bacterium]|nr:ribbon-helix-helix protein, CopG family [Actinomycetota bacterium]
MPNRNVTLSLPDDLVRRAKVLAAQRDTSISALVRGLLDQLVGDGTSYDTAWRDEEAFMAGGPLRIGDRRITRDEAHHR